MHIEDRASSIEEALWRSSNRGDTDGSSPDAFPGTVDARPDLSQPMTALHASPGYYFSNCFHRDVYSENSCEVRAESRAVCKIYITQYNRPTLLSVFVCCSLVDIYKQRVDIFLRPFSASHNKIVNTTAVSWYILYALGAVGVVQYVGVCGTVCRCLLYSA